ncbi:unnamed protein product [Euphydryas editha]|uniref:Endonuclease/exonuclease/phosphatase domain-containing protein n=1 Tax=Euphydryas editha TaxID=104508 RepID=A0AAU9TGZ6_EUPED|nr:unnamed protein product [Euphydryas editha]
MLQSMLRGSEAKLATYNIRTLSTYERLIELTEALKNIKFDILGLSEVRRFGNKIDDYGELILCYTGETAGKHGVGFIVKQHWKKHIESYIGISERVAILNLNINNRKISLIQVYVPTESASKDDIDKFYETLNEAMKIAHKEVHVMGDFNAKIGQPRADEYLIMKLNGYGTRNTRGERLIEFALEHKLSIINTFFKKRSGRKWTWQSPNGQYKNEIDYVLSNQPKYFQNLEILNINYPSDHRMIRSTLKLSEPKKSRKNFNIKNCKILSNEEEIKQFKSKLCQHIVKIETSKETDTIQESYDKILNALNLSLQQTHSTNYDSKPKKISERTIALIKRRQVIQRTKFKTRSMKNELKALYKLISKHIRQDYIEYRKKHLTKTPRNYWKYKKGS